MKAYSARLANLIADLIPVEFIKGILIENEERNNNETTKASKKHRRSKRSLEFFKDFARKTSQPLEKYTDIVDRYILNKCRQ